MLNFINPEKRHAYQLLMRMDKPIGTYLLMWPTLWALFIAADGIPPLDITLIFLAGVFLMRSAGCVINDFADRKIDGHVKRTQQRPLATGLVSSKEALALFVLLVSLAFILVLFLNWQTIALSVVALLLAAIYPFCKRFTYLPQFVLGAAFSWAIPMAFMAIEAELPPLLWLIYIVNLLWTVAYDTLYAIVDRDDDLKIGVKSTAILFGRYDLVIVALLQALTILGLLLLGWFTYLHWGYFICVSVAALMFAKQIWDCRYRERDACFNAFLSNHKVGAVVFVGVALGTVVG